MFARHGIALYPADAHDILHGLRHAADILIDEVGQRAVAGCVFLFGILSIEQIPVGHGDEQLLLRGVIIEDSRLGQPDGLGYHLQTHTLVVHRHEQPQRTLQYLFPIRFHL